MFNEIRVSYILLIVIAIISFNCTSGIDRKDKLDFKYPSIKFTSFQQVRDYVEGSWVGKSSLLGLDSLSDLYVLNINYLREDEFQLEEETILKGNGVNKRIVYALLFELDDSFVFEFENKFHRIYYLSEKQLKIEDSLFEGVK